MTNAILLKRSSTQGKVPLTSDLQLGEIALNTYDGKAYFKKDNGTTSVAEILTTSSGVLSTSQLGSGTADSTTYLRGDNTWATITSGATITDDTSSNTTYYPAMATATTGAMLSAKVSSTKLSFHPDTGTLYATIFSGSGASLTSLNASNISSGTVGTGYLGTGSADSTKLLRGDGTWSNALTGTLLVGGSTAIFGSAAQVHAIASAGGGFHTMKSSTPVLNDSIGSIAGYATDGTTTAIAAAINWRADEAWSATNHGSVIQFRTVQNGSGGALTERMRIDGYGNVGIGGTPAGGAIRFDVIDNNSTGLAARVINNNATTTSSSAFLASNGNGVNVQLQTYNNFALVNTSSAHTLEFRTSNTTRGQFQASTGEFMIGNYSVQSNQGRLQTYDTLVGGVVASARFINSSGTASSGVAISLDPGNNGVSVLDSQIRASNNGSNQTNLSFWTSSAAAPTEKVRLDHYGKLRVGWFDADLTYGDAGVYSTTRVAGMGSVATQTGSVYAANYDAWAAAPSWQTLGMHSHGTAETGNLSYNPSVANANAAELLAVNKAVLAIGINSNAPITFATSGLERLRVLGNGDIQIGNNNTASNTLRYFDLWNNDAGASAGCVMRFVTKNSTGAADTTFDIVKYKSGAVYLNNNDSTTTSNAIVFTTAGTEKGRFDGNGMYTPFYARATGLSTSWGTTNGTLTGGFNTAMGTGAGATWLIAGTSGGTFRAGIQSLDSDGQLRIYSAGSYIAVAGGTITGTLSGNATSATTANALNTANYYTVTGLTAAGLTVGNGGASTITMVDTDEGDRYIHCNSNRIGFLNSGGAWGSYCPDDGSWWSDNFMYAASYFSTGDHYYLRSAGGERQVRWQQTGRDVYIYCRDSDKVMGVYDTVGGGRWTSDASGNFVAVGNVTAYSDPRLKENVEKINDPFSILHAINGYTFTWKHGITSTQVKAGKKDYGMMADQVEAVMPEIVTEMPSYDESELSYKTVAYEKLVPVLIEAIKQLEARVKELESK